VDWAGLGIPGACRECPTGGQGVFDVASRGAHPLALGHLSSVGLWETELWERLSPVPSDAVPLSALASAPPVSGAVCDVRGEGPGQT